MKVKAEFMIQLRKEKSWSQDELAIATGLNLRTIQRIENESTASLQSLKAIASALNVDVRDLQFEGNSMLQEIVGKTVEIHMGTNIGVSIDKIRGIVLEADEKWVKIQAKKTTEIVRVELIRHITIVN